MYESVSELTNIICSNIIVFSFGIIRTYYYHSDIMIAPKLKEWFVISAFWPLALPVVASFSISRHYRALNS